MKELVEQVMETQKNVKVAQTKLLKGRRQMGIQCVGGVLGTLPGELPVPSAGPAAL